MQCTTIDVFLSQFAAMYVHCGCPSLPVVRAVYTLSGCYTTTKWIYYATCDHTVLTIGLVCGKNYAIFNPQVIYAIFIYLIMKIAVMLQITS